MSDFGKAMLRSGRRLLVGFFLGALLTLSADAQSMTAGFRSRANTPPRKIVVATMMTKLNGNAVARARKLGELIDASAREAAQRYPGRHLDLVLTPEYALQFDQGGKTAFEQAVELKDPALEVLAEKARQYRTWIVVAMILKEAGMDGVATNAAVLLNREGAVAGIYRKVHPVADGRGVLEDGITPGNDFTVFDCDFGRLGILICYDQSYPASWQALGKAGVEVVALTSESPQTIRPAAAALEHRFYVVTSTPRDNASMFDPIGQTIAQTTAAPVLVHEFDLSYAILHWAANLDNGRALTRRFGDRVGYSYSVREDTGVFWSNDPKTTIGAMIKELSLREMPDALEFSRQLQDKARRPGGFGPP